VLDGDFAVIDVEAEPMQVYLPVRQSLSRRTRR
jgi:hypothetical protein